MTVRGSELSALLRKLGLIHNRSAWLLSIIATTTRGDQRMENNTRVVVGGARKALYGGRGGLFRKSCSTVQQPIRVHCWIDFKCKVKCNGNTYQPTISNYMRIRTKKGVCHAMHNSDVKYLRCMDMDYKKCYKPFVVCHFLSRGKGFMLQHQVRNFFRVIECWKEDKVMDVFG